MSHPDDHVLVDLAINGSDAAQTPLRHHDHVAACPICTSAVAELRRTLSLTRPAATDAGWVAPPATLWESISAQIVRSEGAADQAPPKSAVAHPPASDAAASATVVSLERRRDLRGEPGRPGRDGPAASVRRRLIGAAAGIAAAGLAIGLLTGRALWNEPTTPPVAVPSTATATTVSQVALNTLDANNPHQLGRAAVIRASAGYQLSIDTTKPVDAGSGYLEVWLINRDLKRMVSIGVLRGNGKASFPISQNLIDQGYVVVDVSRQQFIASNAHSGNSVMRGMLPA